MFVFFNVDYHIMRQQTFFLFLRWSLHFQSCFVRCCTLLKGVVVSSILVLLQLKVVIMRVFSDFVMEMEKVILSIVKKSMVFPLLVLVIRLASEVLVQRYDMYTRSFELLCLNSYGGVE